MLCLLGPYSGRWVPQALEHPIPTCVFGTLISPEELPLAKEGDEQVWEEILTALKSSSFWDAPP